MDLQDELKRIEKELLDLIVAHLKDNKLQADVAQQLAKDFLAALPVKDQKDLLEKLKALGTKYPEAQEVYLEEASKVSEQERDRVLTQMRDAIKQGNIDHAITMAKTVTGGKP